MILELSMGAPIGDDKYGATIDWSYYHGYLNQTDETGHYQWKLPPEEALKRLLDFVDVMKEVGWVMLGDGD